MTDQEHIKELTTRMVHQSGHLIQLLDVIKELKASVTWWQEVCKTKDQELAQIYKDSE